MSDELAVQDGQDGNVAFVVGLFKPGYTLTTKDKDRAAVIFRGAGLCRRYIAAAIVADFGGSSATVGQREHLAKLCANELDTDIANAYKMAKHVEIEVELFGPLTTDPKRIDQTISQEAAFTLAKLPTKEDRLELYDRVMRFVGTAGAAPKVTTNITHAVNKRLKAIEAAEAEEAKATREALDEAEAAENGAEGLPSDEENARLDELIDEAEEDGEEPDSNTATESKAPKVSEAANAKWLRQLAFACEILQKPGTIPTRSKIGCAAELRKIADHIEKL